MNIGKLFRQAWHLTWRRKMLWVLGFLSGLTGLAINLLTRILSRWFFASSTRASVLDSLTSQTDQTLWLGRLIGGTIAFSAAHDGKELALVRFDLNKLSEATREQI